MSDDSARSEPRTRVITRTRSLGEYRTFFATAIRYPKMVGAATPTSPAVATTAAQIIPTTGSPVVVELGPGTGSISNGIQRRLPAGGRHIGVELSENLAEHLRTHKPSMEVIHGDAKDLRMLLDGLGVGRVDAVISSIPWSLLDDRAQAHILRQVTEALAPQGAFTALAYLHAERSPGGKRFRRRLAETFDEVVTPVTWQNIPPIMHYLCRRPLQP